MKRTIIQLLIGIFAGIIICHLLFHGCNKPKVETKTETKTVYVSVKDSGDWKRLNPVTVIPILQGGQIPTSRNTDKPIVLTKVISDTVWYYEPTPTGVLDSYYSLKFYRDTTKTEYGAIITEDSVQENSIIAHRVLTDLRIPVTTNTITNTIYPPKKVKGYLTGYLAGRRQDPVQAAGGGFMVQLKNDEAIEVGAIYHFNLPYAPANMQYYLSYKHKLSFHKK
jgi:hypothetical protein